MSAAEEPTWHVPGPPEDLKAVRIFGTSTVYLREGDGWRDPVRRAYDSWGHLVTKGVVAARVEDAFPLPWSVEGAEHCRYLTAANGAHVTRVFEHNEVAVELLLCAVNAPYERDRDRDTFEERLADAAGTAPSYDALDEDDEP